MTVALPDEACLKRRISTLPRSDDRLPGTPPAPLTPELRAELESLMNEQALRWLDEPVPALGELTPRAACATEKGRRRVARMIRTMPAMQVPGGEIPAPGERILR